MPTKRRYIAALAALSLLLSACGFALRGSTGIADSLRLGPSDLGLSMLPLHHVGGISCNLLAPLLAASPMRFAARFDAAQFFAAVQCAGSGADAAASWCYLVPAAWSLVLRCECLA